MSHVDNNASKPPECEDSISDWLRLVAHHEAGHACAALMLGKPYGCAIFGEQGEGGGIAGARDNLAPAKMENYTAEKLAGAYRDVDIEAVLTNAIVVAAGAVAVALLRNEDRDLTFLKGADREIVDEAARAVLGGSPGLWSLKAFHKLAIARARDILAPQWSRVQQVATELLQRRVLSSADVAAAMWSDQTADQPLHSDDIARTIAGPSEQLSDSSNTPNHAKHRHLDNAQVGNVSICTPLHPWDSLCPSKNCCNSASRVLIYRCL